MTPLGVERNGGCRWLNLAGVQFQVAEVVKIGVIFFVAYMIHRHPSQARNPFLTIYIWIVGGMPAALLLFISNDLSSSLVILGMTFMLSLVYMKTPKLHLAMLILVIVAVGVVVCMVATNMPDPDSQTNFRIMRIAAWIDPERYYKEAGFQTIQAKKAIISGSILGKGLGRSLQKWDKLPEVHTDMIFAVICEELGALGAGLLIIGYVFLLYHVVKIAVNTEGLFESVLVTGVFGHLAIQILFNIGVNLGLLPNTGLPLPLVSYGGTSVAFILMEIGMVLKIQHRNKEREKRRMERT